jgi:hypothetical protein
MSCGDSFGRTGAESLVLSAVSKNELLWSRGTTPKEHTKKGIRGLGIGEVWDLRC